MSLSHCGHRSLNVRRVLCVEGCPYCLPTVGLIVPVFGLALAPYWRLAGCRAHHRARTLSPLV